MFNYVGIRIIKFTFRITYNTYNHRLSIYSSTIPVFDGGLHRALLMVSLLLEDREGSQTLLVTVYADSELSAIAMPCRLYHQYYTIYDYTVRAVYILFRTMRVIV